MVKKRLTPVQFELLCAIAEQRGFHDLRGRGDVTMQSLIDRKLVFKVKRITGENHLLTIIGDKLYKQLRHRPDNTVAVRTHTIRRPDHLILIVTDPMSGSSGRFTVYKIMLTGFKEAKVIGRELSFKHCLELAG